MRVLSSRPYFLGATVGALILDTLIAWLDPTAFPVLAASQVALAIGTIALAYAALLQVASSAVSRAEQRNDRMRDREPNLVIGLRGVMTEHAADSGLPPENPGARSVRQFEEEELFLENVGPGIAGQLSARVITLTRDIPVGQEPSPDERDPARQCVGPKELLHEDHGYQEDPLGLTSTYLALGPDNRMRLFNTDERERWSAEEDMQDDRAYIVSVEYSDLDGIQKKKAVGGAFWAPKVPGINGEPTDIDLGFESRSRWILARSDLVQKVLGDFESWKTTSKEAEFRRYLDGLRAKQDDSEFTGI